MYQPTLGRFLSRDPISTHSVDVLTDTGFYSDRLAAMSASPWYYGGNWENTYVYARNNSLRYVDPSGMVSVVIVVPVVVITLGCTYCGGFSIQKRLRYGGTTANPAQQGCIDNAAAWLRAIGMPNTASCAGGGSVSKSVAAGNLAETAIDPLCLCSATTYLKPSTATCNTCASLVELISTLYHECVHQGQCALTSTDQSRERDAYCSEAAFDHGKLLGQCQAGLCGNAPAQINQCLRTVHDKRNESIQQCKDRGGTVNYRIPFN